MEKAHTIDIETTLEYLPNKPGVYQFINTEGKVIYVGKAKDLKKRVSSYFKRNLHENAKVRVMISKVSCIKHIIVSSESDALLLENNLIKKIQPRYNILLKDDKTYPWICIKFEPFPRVFSTRRIVKDGSQYFGPYTSGVLLKTILELIRALYPLRTCNLILTKMNIESDKFKACLEHQIGNCLAPCIGKQNSDDYHENIKSIVELLNGNIHSVKRILIRKMNDFAKNFQFEDAQLFKNKLQTLERFQAKSCIVNPKLNDLDVFSIIESQGFACVNYLKIINGSIIQSHNLELKKNLDETKIDLLTFAITELRERFGSTAKEIVVPLRPEYALQGIKYVVPNRGDKLKLIDLSLRNAKGFVLEKLRNIEKQDPQLKENRILASVQREFKTKELPRHIECFDNSNLQGSDPVSACVVFKNGKPAKKEYRLFNIKSVVGSDDYASMMEVVGRRYRKQLENNEPLPQLVIIDGGKGQLSASYKILKELGIQQKVQIIGIAKRLEEIFFPGDPVPLYLEKSSEALRVVQNARNEAHRFGISHHRNRRSKSFLASDLSNLKGVGEKTVQILFKKFKNKNTIANASFDELEKLLGEKKANIIYYHFKVTSV